PLLTAQPTELPKLVADFQNTPIGNEDNVLKTGSTTAGITFDSLVESDFSTSGPDVSAVGEGVPSVNGLVDSDVIEQGTSFSAPQVAALASYLWLLSDDLRLNQRSQVARQAILANVRHTAGAGPVIDAYATTLSLDPAAGVPDPATWTARLAIM